MPFLIYSINIEDAKFPCVDAYEVAVSSLAIKNAAGSSIEFSKKNAIFAAFGEFNERLSMYYSKRSNIPRIQALSIDGSSSSMSIEPTKFYLNFNLKSLSKYNKNFQDSCGVASHINSNSSVLASLLEFVERQSLIVTWIGMQRKKEYKFEDILHHLNFTKFDTIFSKTKTLMNKFSYLKCYNISIFPNIFVLFIVGYNSEHYSLGLSAGNCFLAAYRGALKEFIQCYLASRRIKNGESLGKMDLYKDYYLNLSIQEFYDNYKFLERSDPVFLHNKDMRELTNKVLCIYDILKSLNKLGIDPYIVSIPPQNKRTRLKITKVFSPDAFPHMYVPLLDPEQYKICKILNMNEFPNKGKQIPFP